MYEADRRLELQSEELKAVLEQVIPRLGLYLDTLPEQPAHDVSGAEELALRLVDELPEKGEDLNRLLDVLFNEAVPTGFNAAGPGYLAFIPGGGLPLSAVADLISSLVNRYVTVWKAAPGLAQLETNVVRWFCRIVEYPREALGFLTTGGSLANFSALVTARCERLPEDFFQATLYFSDQVHHSLQKSARMAGFPAHNLRVIESDSRFRLRPDLLEAQIKRDRESGMQPFLVVASAGTTNTGAIDPLEEIAEICTRHGLWFHLDAAYGGFFMLTAEGRKKLRTMSRADSIVLDPHKGLFLPYGTGCLLVRDGQALYRTHSTAASYMPELQQDPNRVDFCELSPELSRDFRALRVWLPFKLVGAGCFRHNLTEKLQLTDWAWRRLQTIDDIEIVSEPELSIVTFRLRPPSIPDQDLNDLNRLFLKLINEPKRVYLTSTVVRDRFIIRICVLSFRTHLEQMQAALEDIRTAAERARIVWAERSSD